MAPGATERRSDGATKLAGLDLLVPVQLACLRCVFFVSVALASPALAIDLRITTVDGKTASGLLVQLTPEIVIADAVGNTRLSWSDVLDVRPVQAGAPADADETKQPLRFLLADGSDFAGRIERAAADYFIVALPDEQRCRLELSTVSTIVSRSADETAKEELDGPPGEADRSADVAVIVRGDRSVVLRGAVQAITAEHVQFRWKDRDLPLPWDRVAGIRLARATPRGASSRVCLTNGDAFAGRIVGGSEEGVTLQSSVFDRLQIAWSRIDRIECRSDRVVFLSDADPSQYEFTPLFTKEWTYARDRSLTGAAIQLGGRTFAKGVAMHSQSSLTYALDGRFTQFAATVGIADEMQDRGNVTLAVLGDGRALWSSSDVRGGQQPLEVLIDVTDVRELTLQVGWGDDLDLSDHVCWGAVRVIR